jgi:hypothetical protein
MITFCACDTCLWPRQQQQQQQQQQEEQAE